MKKYLLPIILTSILFYACKSKRAADAGVKMNETDITASDTSKVAPSFFPVTNYILGQVTEIKKTYTSVKYYLKRDGHLDSTILKPEGFELYLDELRHPAIDSVSMSKYFREVKFNDETLGLTTLTYDPVGALPDNIPWKRWDVYIEPETGFVKRIYMVKRISADRIAQFTWLSAEQFKMVFINDKDAEHPKVIDEMLFKWVY